MIFLLSLAWAGPADGLKALVSRPTAELVLEVGGDDGSLDPGDRAHLTVSNRGAPLSELGDPSRGLLVSLRSGEQVKWGYTAALGADASIRLPLIPDADEPWPGESPTSGSRSLAERLFDVGDPGLALDVTVSVFNPRSNQWVVAARAPLTWNLDRVSIGEIQAEESRRFRVGAAADAVWPAPASQDAAVKKLAAGLVPRALPAGDQLLGWNLQSSSWWLVRNSLGVVTEDRWKVHVGFRHGAECFQGDVQLVRPYVGTTPQAARITGISATTAQPIRCETITK